MEVGKCGNHCSIRRDALLDSAWIGATCHDADV